MSAASLPQDPAAAGLAVTARGLSKRFGDRQVLVDLDLQVPAGQFLAIVGRSGCGKSTLLRLLSGLEAPSAGAFWFGDTRDAPPPSSRLRIMFQEPRLLPWARVDANVEVGLGRAGAPEEDRDRVAAALEAVGLADRADQWPATLSGGQKQRVALARALVSRPRFLAFDEPLGALDALTRIEMQALITRVHAEQRFTAILVTHDVREAIALADRVVMIENGSIALDVDIDLPRPRQRDPAATALLEHSILTRLLQSEQTAAA